MLTFIQVFGNLGIWVRGDLYNLEIREIGQLNTREFGDFGIWECRSKLYRIF